MAGDLIGLVDQARDYENTTHTDTCVITRGGTVEWFPGQGEVVTNGVTIVPADSEAAPVPCRVRMPSRLESKSLAGEHLWSLKDAILRLSANEPGAENVRSGDVVTVKSTVRGVGLTRSYEVVATVEGSHMSSARFVIRRGE